MVNAVPGPCHDGNERELAGLVVERNAEVRKEKKAFVDNGSHYRTLRPLCLPFIIRKLDIKGSR